MKDKRKKTPKTAHTPSANIRGIAFLLLIPAILSLVSAVWMACQTMGINLLFVTASRGQLYRQYPVFFVLGLILLMVSVLLLRANPAQSKTKPGSETAEDAILPAKEASAAVSAASVPAETVNAGEPSAEEMPAEAAPVQEEAPAAIPAVGTAKPRFCTNCGAPLTPDAKFCIKCGTSAAAEDEQP